MSALSGKLIELLFNRWFYQKGFSVPMSSNEGLRLACRKCGQVLGVLDESEAEAYIFGTFEADLCFDCDPESAATVPSLFWQWQKSDAFVLGDVSFICDGHMLIPAIVSHERAHERTRAPVLSSYTYLNRINKNHAIFPDGRIGYPCRVCEGEGEFSTGKLTVECSFCDGAGLVFVAILLPSWLLGLGCENV